MFPERVADMATFGVSTMEKDDEMSSSLVEGHQETAVTECGFAELLERSERLKQRRAEVLPDVHACLRVMMDAHERLKDLGWDSIIYCPKDGANFKAIEFGSTGVFDCVYHGEWPHGTWLVADGGDLFPSRPVMYLKPYPPTRIRGDDARTLRQGTK